MLLPSILSTIVAGAALVAADLTSSNLNQHVDVLALDYEFGPVKEAYWTGYPHHRRTPFAISPDGTKAFLAYLDSSGTDVHVQQVDPDTFASTGTAVTVSGAKEAGGLVAHNNGFALLTNEAMPSGTTNAPPSDTPVPVLYRYTNGAQTWKTWLGGPDVHASEGLSMSPDLNGDLVYSESAKMYGAYFVITDYEGDAAGHYGDSIQYVADDGTLKTITGASSSWGCSHNTGIAFEAADEPPFASICAEDHGAIWLNTDTQTMYGVKISNENTTNGASNEPMGGMSGSYSSLARFIDSDSYIFSWVSRGAIDLTADSWMGDGFTCATNRTVNRNVAIALFSDKSTLDGKQAISTVGAASGDSQVNWITKGSADTSNAHVAAFDSSNALVTWEEIENPICDFIAMGCRGTFSGSYFQQVDSSGAKVGEAFKSMDTYVAGDMVNMPDGRLCWPYVSMEWDLSSAVPWGGSTATTKKISFACMSLGGGSSTNAGTTAVSSASSSSVASAVAAEKSSTTTRATKYPVTTTTSSAAGSPTSTSKTSSKATSKPTSKATTKKTSTKKTSTKKTSRTTAPVAPTSFITHVKTSTTKTKSTTTYAAAQATTSAAARTPSQPDRATVKQLMAIIRRLMKMLQE